MGNRPKPTRLKLLEGNPGGRPLNRNEPEPGPGIPSMPEWLGAFPVAVAEWTREANVLNNMGVLTGADAGILAMRCYISSQIQELAADVKGEGRTFQSSWTDMMGDEKTISKTNPKAIQLKNLITEYRQIGSLLGFDPASRTRLSVEPGRGVPSRFDGLINRVGREKP